MKKNSIVFIILLLLGLQTWAAKSYEMEVRNLVQVNETEFTFDVRMRNTNPAEPFAIESIQWQFSFNPAIKNGGGFRNAFLTYVSNTTDLVGSAIIPTTSSFTTDQLVFQWVTLSLDIDGETTLFGDGDWKRVGTFRVRLSTVPDGTTLNNFGDVALNYQFIPTQVIVTDCPYYEDAGVYYRLDANFSEITTKTLTNSVDPNMQLAGYYMYANTDWGTAANWNNSVAAAHPAYHQLPGAANNALVGVPAVISTTTRASIKNLYYKVGGSLTIKSDATGTGYLIHNNAGVLATMERYLSQTKYHYVSSPISNATNSLFQGVLGDDDFWEWNEVGNLWNNLNAVGVNPSGALNVAQGYAVAYKNSATTKSFVGTLNTGDKSFPATFTNTWMQEGYNFVGNPYASAISAPTFISQNPLLEGGLYFWDETSNYNGVRWDYATYTLVGGVSGGGAGNVPNGFIAPSQGFMVKVTAAGNVNFKNNMRVTDEAPFFKSGEEISRAWLSVTGPEGDYNEILAGFIEQGQTGIDITDAVKLKGNDKLAFYMQYEGNDYVIQGLPVFDQSKSYALPLGIDAGFTGAYTFKMREIENFDSQVMFTLEDKLNGTFFDLRGNAEYVAQIVDAGEIRDRFVMHINGVTAVPEVAKQLTKVYATNNQIVIELVGNNKILDVEVLNTLGQTITKTQVNATNATLNINGSNVVYIVRVRTNQGVESHKILLH